MNPITIVIGLIVFAVLGGSLVALILLFKEKFYEDAPYDKN